MDANWFRESPSRCTVSAEEPAAQPLNRGNDEDQSLKREVVREVDVNYSACGRGRLASCNVHAPTLPSDRHHARFHFVACGSIRHPSIE